MTVTTQDAEVRPLTRIGRLARSRHARVTGAVLTSVCGVIVLISASGKLTNQASVVELLDQVEVDGLLRDALPFLQIAGGVGAIASLFKYPRLGVVALACLAMYFVGAVFAHVRVGDGASDFAVPLGYAVVMAAAAAFRGVTISEAAQSKESP